jgi:hypothetical protein
VRVAADDRDPQAVAVRVAEVAFVAMAQVLDLGSIFVFFGENWKLWLEILCATLCPKVIYIDFWEHRIFA